MHRKSVSDKLHRITKEDVAPETLAVQMKLSASTEKVGEGIMNAHTQYKIEVKTSLPSYKQANFSAVRRFKDFVWLREKLVESHKGNLVPPLPEKQIINRFNAEFIEHRRRELERFLLRIASHPVLVESRVLQNFLESESLNTNKKEQSSNSTSSSSGGFFSLIGAVSNTAKNTVESIQHLNTFTSVSEPDQWFDAKKNYIVALETNLHSLVKAVSIMIKRQKELEQSYSDIANFSSLLSSAEADHSSWICHSFGKLSEISTSLTPLNETLVEHETAFFEDALRDYVRIIGAVKEILHYRNDKLIQYQNATKNLDSKKEKFEKTRNSKLQVEIEQAEKKVEDTKAEFNNVSNIVKAEIQRFEVTKAKDIKHMLVKLTQANMNYGLQYVDQWKAFLSNDLSTDPLSSVNQKK